MMLKVCEIHGEDFFFCSSPVNAQNLKTIWAFILGEEQKKKVFIMNFTLS